MIEKESVAIVIVNYNSSELLINLLDSLWRMKTDSNYSLIIVDNNSSSVDLILLTECLLKQYNHTGSGSFEVGDSKLRVTIHEHVFHKNKIYFVKSPTNGGFATGCNIGSSIAVSLKEFGYIWFLNPDTNVDSDCLENIILKFSSNKNYSAVGCRIVDYNNPDVVQVCGGGSYHKIFGLPINISKKILVNDEEKIENKLLYLHGSSMVIKTEMINKYLGFCESYFHYFEELDFFSRFNSSEMLGYASNAVVYHLGGASSLDKEGVIPKRRYASAFSEYYMFRNRILFCRYHYPCMLSLVMVGISYAFIKRVLSGRFMLAKTLLKATADSIQKLPTKESRFFNGIAKIAWQKADVSTKISEK
jgi:GT2 family glycosyltransferase